MDSVAMERRHALEGFFWRRLILRIKAKPRENPLDCFHIQNVSPLLG